MNEMISACVFRRKMRIWRKREGTHLKFSLMRKASYNIQLGIAMRSTFCNQIFNTDSCTEECPDSSLERINQSKNKYTYWSQNEKNIYVSYLRANKQIMANFRERKRIKVFLQMSKLIKSRNPKQVKSHHQKLIKQHHTIEALIQFFENADDSLKDIPTPQKTVQQPLLGPPCPPCAQIQINENLFLEGFNSDQWATLLSFRSRTNGGSILGPLDQEDFSPEAFDYEQWEHQF